MAWIVEASKSFALFKAVAPASWRDKTGALTMAESQARGRRSRVTTAGMAKWKSFQLPYCVKLPSPQAAIGQCG